MKKLVLGSLIALVGASVVFAEVDSKAMRRLDDIENGNSIGVLYKAADVQSTDDVIVGDDLNVGDSGTVSNALNVNGVTTVGNGLAYSQTSLAVTSGQILVLSANDFYVLTTPSADLTVTCTIAAVSASYTNREYRFIDMGSNNVVIVDAAPVYNSGVIGPKDVSTYFVQDTNVIIQTSTANN